MTTNVHFSDEAQWAVGVGARLRMVQASLADDDPAARRDYLAEEIEREIRTIPDSRRKAYLEALADRFPQGEGAVASGQAMPAAAVEESPESLVNHLAALARTMPEDQRYALSSQLRNAGFAVEIQVAGAGETTDEIPVELQKRLGLTPEQKLDRKRAIRLMAGLIDLVVTMDQVAWNLWKNLAPAESRVRRDPGPNGDFRKSAAMFVTGDPEVNLAQMTDLLGKTRQLIAGVLAALGAAGKIFAAQHLTRFSPAAIQEEANKEPGFFVGPEQKCWRKYKEVFGEINGAVIEQEIAGIIVKYAEDLILGAGRTGGGPGAEV